MNLYISTGNKGKVAEIIPLVKEFLPNYNQVIARAPKEAEESEKTFEGNAKIKSVALVKELMLENIRLPFAVLSDDSGLEVDALGGRPGVNSARYSGEHGNSEENIQKLLLEMRDLQQRGCRYVCGLYLHVQNTLEDSKAYYAEGYCVGLITQEAKGSGGFGYDPVFWSSELNKRMSEASLEEKNNSSHRRHAFERLAALKQ